MSLVMGDMIEESQDKPRPLVFPAILPDAFTPYWKERLSFEDYHADHTYLPSSAISELLKSRKHFLRRWVMGRGQKESKALRDGSLVHEFLLEPDEFWKKAVDVPVDVKPGNNKAWKAFKEANEYAHILSLSDREMIEGIFESLKEHEIAGEIFNPERKTFREISGYWRHNTGVACRIRPDLLLHLPERTILIEVKTAADVRKWAFAKQMDALDYHTRAAFYLDGATQIELALGRKPVTTFAVVAVEKEEPYALCVWVPNELTLDLGRRRYERAIHSYIMGITTNTWPCYQTKAEDIEVPQYAFERENIDEYLFEELYGPINA